VLVLGAFPWVAGEQQHIFGMSFALILVFMRIFELFFHLEWFFPQRLSSLILPAGI
jgi:hypothetical protein